MGSWRRSRCLNKSGGGMFCVFGYFGKDDVQGLGDIVDAPQRIGHRYSDKSWRARLAEIYECLQTHIVLVFPEIPGNAGNSGASETPE